ncbi:MAG: PAS domain S-box protein [Acidobacteriota bacterium]
MFTRNLSIVARVVFTILMVTVATLLRFALEPILELRVPFILYFPTIVLCAWFGGLWQGLLSTVLGGLIAWFAFREPQFSFKFSDPGILAQLIIFLLAGTLISLLAENLHRSRRKTEASEAKERQQREWLRVTLASIGDGVIATDTNGIVTFLNPVAESLTGWTQEDADGQPLEKIFHIVNEQTRMAVDNPALRAINEGVIVGLANHTVLIAKDGTEKPIDDSGAPIKDVEGRIFGAVLIFRDITERRLAEEKFRLVVEASPAAKVMINEAGQMILVNSQAEQLFGYTRDELIGQPVEILVPERFRGGHLNYRAGFIRMPQTRAMGAGRDLFGLRKDGTEVPIEIGLNPIEMKGQTLILSSIVDITERKRAEEALRAKEAELEVIISQTPFMLTRCSRDLRYRFVSPAYATMLGRRPEEIAGKPIVEIIGEAGFKTILPHMEKVLAGSRVKYESEVHFQEVGLRFLQVSYVPEIDEEGNVKGWIASILDFTEGKRAEDEIRTLNLQLQQRVAESETLLEILPVGVWIGNKDCSQITGNRAGYEIFGLPPGINASVTGAQSELPEGLRILVNGEEVPSEELPMQKVARTGKPWRNFEHAIVFPEGATKTIYGSVAPLFDDQGEVRGVLAAYMDFTERKRVEEERAKLLVSERAAREQAEAASRAKDEFVAMISHEIRSPLNAILGWAQMLRTGKFNQAETQRAIATIERNARIQGQLIEDLLDISRVITGKMTLTVRPVEIAQIVEAAIETMRPAAEAKAIQLNVHLEPKGSLVSGDPNRLQQIVWNLLANAVKFTPSNGRIEVKVDHINTHLQLTVSDSGAGISAEFLPFVFDRFSQASTGSERRYGGLGLGLAIVRHLVELHGGTVQVDSPGEGHGATFTVTLPVKSRTGGDE